MISEIAQSTRAAHRMSALVGLRSSNISGYKCGFRDLRVIERLQFSDPFCDVVERNQQL